MPFLAMSMYKWYDYCMCDDNQFCFIISVSDELYKEECLKYISALEIPDGHTIDIITIEGADSLSVAYNAGMQASPAKYKIYLMQELLIMDRRFLYELLEVFADPQIGMAGVIGAESLSGDGDLRNSDCTGTWGEEEESGSFFYWYGNMTPAAKLTDVMAVDGRLFATQTDIPWRDELFTGDRYPVISQSLEFRKAGYRVAVMPKRCAGEMYIFDRISFDHPSDEQDRKRLLEEYADQICGGQPKTRIMYPDMGLVSTWNIPQALALNDMDVVFMEYTGTPEKRIEQDIRQVATAIRRLHPDAAMTHDYYVPIALACAEQGIPYISWIYDSIQVALYDESISLPTNYIFDFDRLQAGETKERGGAYVKHLPLAANPYLADTLDITKEDEKRFSCDISFIGSLYRDSDFQIPLDRLEDRYAYEIRKLFDERLGVWDNGVRFAGRLSDGAIEEIARKIMPGMGYDRKLIGDRRYIEETFLSRGVSHLERLEALKRLGELSADVRLYTHAGQACDGIPGVRIEGSLNYNSELPKAYYLSRINLNITLPSIRSGVPLRVFDILSSGGFLLTNDQPELSELFEPGRDLEVYHSYDEMVDKAKYYLTHERERLQIVLNGHKKVREKFSYELQTGRILKMVSEDLVCKGKSGLIPQEKE